MYSVVDSDSKELQALGEKAFRHVGTLVEKLHFRTALRVILELSSQVNQYIEHRTPWSKIREDGDHAAETIGVALEIVEALRRLLAPFVPKAVDRFGKYLGREETPWEYDPLPPGTPLGRPQPLFEKFKRRLRESTVSKVDV